MRYLLAAQLGTELPSLPEEIQLEVQLYFKYLVAWVRTTLREGSRNDNIQLHDSAEVEAQSFVAVVHGAMISARALGSSDIFNLIRRTTHDDRVVDPSGKNRLSYPQQDYTPQYRYAFFEATVSR